MKHLLPITLFILCLTSCKKDNINVSGNGYMEQVKKELRDSVTATDYASLDFNQARLAVVDTESLYLLRVPFKEKNIANDFVLLQTNKEGAINKGKIIHIERSTEAFGTGKENGYNYQGSIIIQSLNRATSLRSLITDGYIEAFHPDLLSARAAVKLPDNELQEVVVIGYYDSGGISYSDWIALQDLLSGGADGGGGYYSPLSSGGSGSSNGGSGSAHGGGNSSSGNNVSEEPVIHPSIETYVDHPAIDLEKYLKCFDAIPDAGATCSIEIFSDLPVNGDPTKIFNWQTESPGHTFLQIKKSNGSQTIVQNIGFYPSANWKSILNSDPVTSKFVDDGGHEFDASLKMNLTSHYLQLILQKIRSLVAIGLKYDMDEFNCTDFALQVFNSARLVPLDIVKIDVPGGMAINGSNTPHGLYLTLEQMKKSGNPEAGNITIGNAYNWVSASHGPCY